MLLNLLFLKVDFMVDNKNEQGESDGHLLQGSPIAQLDNILPLGEYEEEESIDGKTVKSKGVYILPNLFTTAGLFCGFYSIIQAMNGEFEKAAIAIFVAMIMDILDGRIARLINAQSAFGAQYDSLSDMVSFGLAPALVMFSWALSSLGKVGWAVAFIYVAGAALRLARFNTQVAVADKRYFTGLASPAAAAILASLVWIGSDLGWFDDELPVAMRILAAIVTALAGFLMVSNIRYHSFKGFDLKGRVPFAVIILVIIVFSIVVIDPARVFLVLLTIYGLSGPVLSFKKQSVK
jgi:CDP-diacylglycerol---serine O-phosphatidyltransferase